MNFKKILILLLILNVNKAYPQFCESLPHEPSIGDPGVQAKDNEGYIALIKEFGPIFYLNKDERALPISATEYFTGKHSRVVYREADGSYKEIIPKGQVTMKKIYDLRNKFKNGDSNLFFDIDDCIKLGSNPSSYKDSNGSLTTPVYVIGFEQNGNIYLQFLTLFGLNAPYNLGSPIKILQGITDKLRDNLMDSVKGKKISDIKKQVDEILTKTNPIFKGLKLDKLLGYPQAARAALERVPQGMDVGQYIDNFLRFDVRNEHEGDLEHVTLEIDKNTKKLKRIYFGSHGRTEGMWLDADNPDIQWQGTHPIVFVAEGGHGNYPKAGTYVRIYGLANDQTNKGIKWDPKFNLVYKNDDERFDPNVHGWLYFPGNYGAHGVNAAHNQGWWMDPAGGDLGQYGSVLFCANPNDQLCLAGKALKASPR